MKQSRKQKEDHETEVPNCIYKINWEKPRQIVLRRDTGTQFPAYSCWKDDRVAVSFPLALDGVEDFFKDTPQLITPALRI
ncbi:hypothetical protein Y1Q_0004606 [Alligator mississippiensis]|uniref:Uncharacterized protein n=1 Tax=Alligator mississippiensis TaxID=8496 RepID=A0A151MHL4_ALLMI|nr:hypothetical protein Y1Q_0004606 [Alligator mississippiensis]